MPRPTLFEITRLLHTDECPDIAITGVATDSREVKPGMLFVALKGAKVDGHDFLDEAFANGAVAALVEPHVAKNERYIRVVSPLDALQAIAAWHVARSKAQIIGITGSLGKTTTKEFLYTLLKSTYKTACTSGNQNSQVGMAASLINNVEGDEEFLVVEMGMTKPGHIKSLVDIAQPDFALLTEIALVHAENFASIDDIARAKAEIFSHPKTKLALISKASSCCELLQSLAHCQTMVYEVEEALFSQISLPAPHVYKNLQGAICMAKACGMTDVEISAALNELKLPAKRLENVQKGKICFIDDSYNAAEPSLKAALSYLKEQDGKRKIAVIGHMRELGSFSEGCHKAVGEHAIGCADSIYLLGEECTPIISICKEAQKPCKHFIDFSELVATLKNELQDEDLVLLKGSRSNGLWRVLDHF